MRELILIFLLASSAVYAGEGNERREALVQLLDEIYKPDEATQNKSQEIKEIRMQLQSQLSTCFLPPVDEVEETTSEFLKVTSCETLVEEAEKAGVSRVQVKNALLKWDGDESAEVEDRKMNLQAVLDEIYGPDDTQKTSERGELIKHFQTCKYASTAMDSIFSIFKTFGCESLIKTAHKAEISYFDVEEAISAALPDEQGEATLAQGEASSEEKSDKAERKVSKP